MNVFIVDEDPVKAAQMLCDSHVGKMMLEAGQIMSTVARKLGHYAPYASTHETHPCVIWTERSLENFMWLSKHAMALHYEYMRRFKRGHGACTAAIWSARLQLKPSEFIHNGLTKFAVAVPEALQVVGPNGIDVVASYRSCYAAKERAWARLALANAAASCINGGPARPKRPVMSWRSPASRPSWLPDQAPRWIPNSTEIGIAKSYAESCRVFDAARLTDVDIEEILRRIDNVRQLQVGDRTLPVIHSVT